MNQDETIKLEMRLSAIEYLLCRLNVTLLRATGLPTEKIDAALTDFVADASRQKFPGLDPALSDHASAEWTDAVARLVQHQKAILAQLAGQAGR